MFHGEPTIDGMVQTSSSRVPSARSLDSITFEISAVDGPGSTAIRSTRVSRPGRHTLILMAAGIEDAYARLDELVERLGALVA